MDLKQLIKDNPVIKQEVVRLLQKVPALPEYDPQKDNVEEWKSISSTRKGYLLCLAEFGITKGDL